MCVFAAGGGREKRVNEPCRPQTDRQTHTHRERERERERERQHSR